MIAVIHTWNHRRELGWHTASKMFSSHHMFGVLWAQGFWFSNGKPGRLWEQPEW